MSESNAIRERRDIPREDTWALEDLFPSDDAWQQALDRVMGKEETIQGFAGRLGESGQTLCAFLALLEETDTALEALGNYAMRAADQDTRNSF